MSHADPLETSWKPLSGDLWPSDVIPKVGSVGFWALHTSSCSQAEEGTAVLPEAVSLTKEKHPANSIKNVSQRPGEGSASLPFFPASSCVLGAGTGAFVGQDKELPVS